MQIKPKYLLVAIFICFVTLIHAQHTRYAIRNGIAIGGGLTQFDIKTDNFDTTKGNGWMFVAGATVDLPHKWYTVSYAMQLSENKLDISGRESLTTPGDESLEYKLFAAQIGFNVHIKLIDQNLTLDFGPQLQYNSKLELTDDSQESYFVNGFDTLLAEDISDISQFNVNGMVGLSAGLGALKLRAQYMYGVTNMLNKLNDQDFETGSSEKFRGNMSMLAFTAMITF